MARMRYVYGIGEVKLRDFGAKFLELIDGHCKVNGISRDMPANATPVRKDEPPRLVQMSAIKENAFTLFRQGASVEEVAQQIGRAKSTVTEYLCDFIVAEKPEHIGAWVPQKVYQQVAGAARTVGTRPLKLIFMELKEAVAYDLIRLVVAHLGE
jgi:hypothetical protein